MISASSMHLFLGRPWQSMALGHFVSGLQFVQYFQDMLPWIQATHRAAQLGALALTQQLHVHELSGRGSEVPALCSRAAKGRGRDFPSSDLPLAGPVQRSNNSGGGRLWEWALSKRSSHALRRAPATEHGYIAGPRVCAYRGKAAA